MLPKQNRLYLKTEFGRIQKRGRIIQGKLFSLLFLNQRLLTITQQPRFAFIVSKKIDKRAIKRNRVKRLLSEAVRLFLPQIRQGVEGVFLAKKEILGKEFAEIKNETEGIFKKANLFK